MYMQYMCKKTQCITMLLLRQSLNHAVRKTIQPNIMCFCYDSGARPVYLYYRWQDFVRETLVLFTQ